MTKIMISLKVEDIIEDTTATTQAPHPALALALALHPVPDLDIIEDIMIEDTIITIIMAAPAPQPAIAPHRTLRTLLTLPLSKC